MAQTTLTRPSLLLSGTIIREWMFATVPISTTNAYAQTGLWFIFNLQIKKIGSVSFIIAQFTVNITYESYLS
jgi:hypothetical protein